jgi:hypothetical protein
VGNEHETPEPNAAAAALRAQLAALRDEHGPQTPVHMPENRDRHSTPEPPTDPALRSLQASLEYKQAKAARASARWPVGGLVASVRQSVSRTDHRLGQLMDLWLELVPEALVGQTRLTAYRGGRLYVSVDGAAARFELDRLLRGGLEAHLRQRFAGTLSGVRLRVGSPA